MTSYWFGVLRNYSICISFSCCRKSKGNTALVATSGGEFYLVDSNSKKIIWSFTSGTPIYSSYQAPTNYNKENASGSSRSPFFFDCGDDWELYIHTEHGRTVYFSELITSITLMT